MATPVPTTNTQFSPPPDLESLAWHSPVPYLFGGLAAMLGLIAFVLLILACSYWKLSNRLRVGDRDLEAGDEKLGGEAVKTSPVYEEKLLVIMAGDVNPTFIATPISNKLAPFGDCHEKSEKSETAEKPVQETGHRESSTEAQEHPEGQEQNQ